MMMRLIICKTVSDKSEKRILKPSSESELQIHSGGDEVAEDKNNLDIPSSPRSALQLPDLKCLSDELKAVKVQFGI